MPTLREIVQNFRNLTQRGQESDEQPQISDRQWAFIVDYHRARLLRDQYNKGQRINEANIQELTITVKKQRCGRWFTEKPLPSAVEVYGQNLITFVGTPLGHAYQKTNAQKAEWEQYAKYTARKPKWYQLGNTLYLVTPPSPSVNVVSVRGVFESPREVYVAAGAELDAYDPLNFTYPISTTLLETLYDTLAKGELQLSIALPPDTVNDGHAE